MVLIFGALALFIIGIVFYTILLKQEKEIGILSGKLAYVDTPFHKGEILKATSIPLIGKPDAIIKKNNQLIPVEVKTGKTPQSPYTNHTMQLMAYCFLIEEHFHKRPKGGYLRYPEKEFKIAYTKEAEQAVKSLVSEMLKRKKKNKEITCSHPEHNK